MAPPWATYSNSIQGKYSTTCSHIFCGAKNLLQQLLELHPCMFFLGVFEYVNNSHAWIIHVCICYICKWYTRKTHLNFSKSPLSHVNLSTSNSSMCIWILWIFYSQISTKSLKNEDKKFYFLTLSNHTKKMRGLDHKLAVPKCPKKERSNGLDIFTSFSKSMKN